MSEDAPNSPDSAGVSIRAIVLVIGAIALCAAAWRWRGREKTPTATQPATAAAPLPTRLEPDELSPAEAEREAPSVATDYRRDVVRPLPVQNVTVPAAPKADQQAEEPPGGPLSRRRDEKKELPEIFRMPTDTKIEQPAVRIEAGALGNGPVRPAPIDGDFAPFGRLVKCQ